jgi:hypothetical protein
LKFLENVVCPISNVKIDSNVSRITVLINALLIALYLYTGGLYFMVLVAIDYGIRALPKPKYSPIRWIAVGIARIVRITKKTVDQAPKLFASRVGFLFAVTVLILNPLSIQASLIVAGVLLVFTILDSVLNFCVGCLTYHYVVFPLYHRQHN